MLPNLKSITLSVFIDILLATVLLANLAYPISNMLIVYIWAFLILTNLSLCGTIILLKLKLKYKYKNVSDEIKKDYFTITVNNYKFFNLMLTMLEMLSLAYLLFGYYLILKISFILFSVIILYLWNIAADMLIYNKTVLEKINNHFNEYGQFRNINEELKGE